MDKPVASSSSSSSHDRAQRLHEKNIELENRRRKAAQARVPSDPNSFQQMRENFETIILEDHVFSEKHSTEFALWQLHYRRIEEFRAHYSAASTKVLTTSQTRAVVTRPDRASKIRSQFKTFLSEATGFYHDLILKIRSKYGLPIGQFYPEVENMKEKDEKKSIEIKNGLLSCHRCLIYLGDLARYKGLYGEGESKSRDYAAASSYYLQATSLWPASGNPHHQLAILATYSGDELMAVYRYFRSLAVENSFATARDNLIVAFEKNRKSYSQLHADPKDPSVTESPVRIRGKERGEAECGVQFKEPIINANTDVDRATEIRQMFKAFCVCFVRLNGILFTRTSLETFEEILSVVSNALHELLASVLEVEPSFGTDSVDNGLFIVILVAVLIFTVNNVKGGVEGQSYADIVQNTLLLKNALTTFYEVMGQLLNRCIMAADPTSSFLLPGVLVFVEWIACHPDVVIRNETDEKLLAAQRNFWSYCISLFNMLLATGLITYDDDDDMSCFTDMTIYEEGENEYQAALWEDFELRGFLPLQPAQTFLDFSSKRSDRKKDKVARVKRILAAGKVIADKITIDHKKVRFDSRQKKFVVGDEHMKTETGSPKSNGGIKETMTVKQLKVESHVEVEEEDEVILFRPNLIDTRIEALAPKGLENVQNKDVGGSQNEDPVSVPYAVYTNSQSVLPVNNFSLSIGQHPSQFQTQIFSGNQQASVSIAGGLKGLSLMENGHVGRMLTGTSQSMVGPSVIDDARVFTHSNTIRPSGSDPYFVGRNIFSIMPSSSLKVSTNRPVRHLGPPPGFSSVRAKHVHEHGAAPDQNPINDGYSWLDGYQLQSSMQSGIQNLPSNRSSQYMNDSVATPSSFLFPGRHVPIAQFEAEKQKNLEGSDSHHESHLQQQYIPLMDQQGQFVWKGNHFL